MICLVAQSKASTDRARGQASVQDALDRSIQLLPRSSWSYGSGPRIAGSDPQALPCLALLRLPSHDPHAKASGIPREPQACPASHARG